LHRELAPKEMEEKTSPVLAPTVGDDEREEDIRLWVQGRAPWYDPQTAGPIQPFIVGIAGGSASGKTTVCHDIITRLATRWVQTLSTDNFYRPLTPEERVLANSDRYNFDHPNAFDWDLLEVMLAKIRKGQRVHIPDYDFKTHSRTEKTHVFYGADVVIVEGILAMYEEKIRNLCDMLIFVDTDSDVRLCRRSEHFHLFLAKTDLFVF
jgi:uridine kinase